MPYSKVEVLLVEDNIHDAELVLRAFKKANLHGKILHLKDGSEALDFLFAKGEFEGRNVQHKPRIIVLDLKMPKVNGIEVLQKIRTNKLTYLIPVVILTSSNEDPDIAACYALGVNSYLVKPVAFAEFMEVVSTMGLYWLEMNTTPR
jgi:two-component system response regulator